MLARMYCEFPPVTRTSDLSLLDPDEVSFGYYHGLLGEEPPTSAHSRSYWHGWLSGMVDGGRTEESDDQRLFRLMMTTRSHEGPKWRI
jgi:hypothetical protein